MPSRNSSTQPRGLRLPVRVLAAFTPLLVAASWPAWSADGPGNPELPMLASAPASVSDDTATTGPAAATATAATATDTDTALSPLPSPSSGTVDLDRVEVRADAHRRGLDLDTVSNTGSRLAIPLRDLPASVSIVDRETIRVSGARTALEVIESAVGMTGMTGVGSIPSYSARGFTGNDVTILRDGIRQNTASQASRPLDSFLFERIEVLKGPASLLYGEGAVGGAVNYVSKRAGDRFEGEALLSAGSWSNFGIGVGAGGPTALDGVGFRLDASYRQERGYVERSDAEYRGVTGELRWDVSSDTTWRLAGAFVEDDVESYYGTPLVYDAVVDENGVREVRRAVTSRDRLVGARIEPISRRHNYNHAGNFARGRNGFGRLIGDMPLGPSWTLRSDTYAATQRLDWQNTESTVWNPTTGLVDRGSFFLIWRRDLQLGQRFDATWSGTLFGRPQRMLLGALYDRNDQDRNSGQPVPSSPLPPSVPLTGFDPGVGPTVDPMRTVNVLTRNAAVYVEHVAEATPRLSVVSGLRYDRIDVERRSFTGAPTYARRYEPVTGRLGVVYAWHPDTSVYASLSHAAQPVTQLVSLGPAQDEFGLQSGHQLEVGLKAGFGQGRGELTLAAYGIEKNDLLTSTVVDGLRYNSQIGAQVSRGAEFELALRPADGWRLSAQLAHLWRARFEDFSENLGDGVIVRNGNTPPNVPRTVAGLAVVRDRDAWRFRAAGRYVGEREANNHNGIQLPAYATLDAGVTRRWDAFALTLRGRNLTDREYAPSAAAGGLVWRLADPRSAEVALEYGF